MLIKNVFSKKRIGVFEGKQQKGREKKLLMKRPEKLSSLISQLQGIQCTLGYPVVLDFDATNFLAYTYIV